ncbi:hypothetical protein M8J75_004219 [Diaphorina citri]|nr:hypothetical protein M8J75_004219 [Diaphorina citri]
MTTLGPPKSPYEAPKCPSISLERPPQNLPFPQTDSAELLFHHQCKLVMTQEQVVSTPDDPKIKPHPEK